MSCRWQKHVAVLLLCVYALAFAHHLDVHAHEEGHQHDSAHCALCVLVAGMSLLLAAAVPLMLLVVGRRSRRLKAAPQATRSAWRTCLVRGPPPSFVVQS